MIQRIDILGETGVPLRAILVTKNEQCPNHKFKRIASCDLIEFYDQGYEDTPDGTFLKPYYLYLEWREL
jgi:hypothetical protein